MAGKLTASFILKLEDQLSGPLAKIEKQLAALGTLGKKLNLGGLEAGTRLLEEGAAAARKMSEGMSAIERGAGRAGAALARMAGHAGHQLKAASDKIGVIGAAVAGISVMEPIKAYSERDKALRGIAITEHLSGPAAEVEIARLNRKFNEDALSTGQPSYAVIGAYADLQGQGIPTSVLDRIITNHSKAATAYNISPEALGAPVGALVSAFKIKDEDMGGTLAAMANATKAGRFKMTDFAIHLPEVAASFASAGITGRGGAIKSFAALETIMKAVGEPGQAKTAITEIFGNMFSPFAERFFAKERINLGASLRKAEKQGVDPLTALLGIVGQATKGLTPVEFDQKLGALIRDATARKGLLALIQHGDEFEDLEKRLLESDQSTLDQDFETRVKSIAFQVAVFTEHLDQLMIRLGRGFSPVLAVINEGLDKFQGYLSALDEKMPGTADKALTIAAGALLLAAALGVLGVVLPAIGAGLSLVWTTLAFLLKPVRLLGELLLWVVTGMEGVVAISMATAAGIAALAAVFVAVAVDIYEHWERFADFFEQIGHGLLLVLAGIADTLYGALTFDHVKVLKGFREISDGIVDIFAGAFGVVKQLFADLWKIIGDPVTAWIADMNKVLDRIKLPGGGHNAPGDDTGLPGVGDNGDGILAPSGATITRGGGDSRLIIDLAPGLVARDAPASVGNFDFTVASRPALGTTLGRP